ncbi:MAG: 50S ribosomal protein L30 [Acidobacteria bacterium]|nr:50S ribosomal protein L30 [Acidobacteriota bacterium]
MAKARATLRIRQVRSGIGNPREMRETLKALGLRRINHVVERLDTPETRGMVHKISHLVEIVD